MNQCATVCLCYRSVFSQSFEIQPIELFMLTMHQVWRKYDQETADKFAGRKAGEFLDPDLAKVFEEQEKRADRMKREQSKDKQMSRSQPKRIRGGGSYYEGHCSNPPDFGGQQHFGRGGYGSRGRGGSTSGRKKARIRPQM